MTSPRQKLREFWIKLGTRRLTEKEFLSETVHDCISLVPIDNSYHVKEVSPYYDKAVEQIVAAMKILCEPEPDGFGGFVAEEFESEKVKAARDALAAYENAIIK